MIKIDKRNILAEITGDILNKPCKPTQNQDIIDAASNAALELDFDGVREAWSQLDAHSVSEIEIKNGAPGPVHN